MNYEIIPTSIAHKAVMQNLLQFYTYDFSEYTEANVEEDGLFAVYPHLEDYWMDTVHRFPYVIMKEEKYIGFVLVRFIQTSDRNYFSIAEFFVMKKYRRQGIGNAVAKDIFDLHKGQWEVFQMEANIPAQKFWKKVITEYTDGKFTQGIENGRVIQRFKNG